MAVVFFFRIKMKLAWSCLVLSVVLCPSVRGEVFTALADMEPLLETEGMLLDSLHSYVRYQEDRLRLLRK